MSADAGGVLRRPAPLGPAFQRRPVVSAHLLRRRLGPSHGNPPADLSPAPCPRPYPTPAAAPARPCPPFRRRGGVISGRRVSGPSQKGCPRRWALELGTKNARECLKEASSGAGLCESSSWHEEDWSTGTGQWSRLETFSRIRDVSLAVGR